MYSTRDYSNFVISASIYIASAGGQPIVLQVASPAWWGNLFASVCWRTFAARRRRRVELCSTADAAAAGAALVLVLVIYTGLRARRRKTAATVSARKKEMKKNFLLSVLVGAAGNKQECAKRRRDFSRCPPRTRRMDERRVLASVSEKEELAESKQ